MCAAFFQAVETISSQLLATGLYRGNRIKETLYSNSYRHSHGVGGRRTLGRTGMCHYLQGRKIVHSLPWFEMTGERLPFSKGAASQQAEGF